MKPGPKIKERDLENKIHRLLQKRPEGLHFSAIQRLSGVKSPNRISAAMKALRSRRLVYVRTEAGAGIPKRVYIIRDPARSAFELERDRLLEEIAKAPVQTADQILFLRERIAKLETMVRGLQDASGYKIVEGDSANPKGYKDLIEQEGKRKR